MNLTGQIFGCVFVFYTEIQDGHQIWRENTFLTNGQMPLHTPSWPKIVVSEINVFLCFTQKFKITAKMEEDQFWGKMDI